MAPEVDGGGDNPLTDFTLAARLATLKNDASGRSLPIPPPPRYLVIGWPLAIAGEG